MYKNLEILTLTFLGHRKYLQGGTLLDALLPQLTIPSHLSFKVSKLMNSNRIEIHYFDPEIESGKNFAATLRWSEGDVRKGLGVLPVLPADEQRREAFEEEKIVELADFSGEDVTLTSPSSYTMIQNIVALNKALLKKR